MTSFRRRQSRQAVPRGALPEGVLRCVPSVEDIEKILADSSVEMTMKPTEISKLNLYLCSFGEQ